METPIGIKETKEAVDFLFDITDAVVDSLESDNKITLKDIPKFSSALWSGMSGISGVEKAPKELADLSPAELKELTDHIAERFDINDDALEEKVEAILVLGAQLTIAIRDVYQLKKKND